MLAIATILLTTAQSILGSLAADKIETATHLGPVALAIDATEQAFPDLDGLRATLEAWVESPAFEELLGTILAGGASTTDAALIGQFLAATDFHTSTPDLDAGRVLVAFGMNLINQFHMSELGPAVHAQRTETMHEATIARIDANRNFLGEGIGHIQQTLTNMASTAISLSSSRAATQSGRQPGETRFDGQLDLVFTLIQGRKFLTAGSTVEGIRTRLAGEAPSVDLQARVAATIGVCALGLHDIAAAREELERALSLVPGHPTRMALLAQVHLLSEEYNAAELMARASLAEDATNEVGAAILLAALERTGQLNILEEYVSARPWLLTNEVTCLTLAQIRFMQGHNEEAERLARTTLKLNKDNATACSFLAVVIADPVRESLRVDPPARDVLPAEVQAALSESENLLTRAIELQESQEDRTALTDNLVTRGAIRALLSRVQDAERDIERALERDPSHLPGLLNGALLQMDRAPSLAAQRFERLRSRDPSGAYDLPYASTLARLGRHAEAVNLARPHVQDAKPTVVSLASATLFRSLEILGNERECLDIATQLMARWHGNPLIYAVVAEHYGRIKQFDTSVELLQEALSYASGNTRHRVAAQLGDVLMMSGKTAEAAASYTLIPFESRTDDVNERLLLAFWRSRQLADGLALATELISSGQVLETALRVEGQIRNRIGDLSGAKTAFKKLAASTPTKPEPKLQLAQIAIRMGRSDEARQHVASLSVEQFRGTPEALIDLAKVKRVLHLPGALADLYEARRLDLSNPEIHITYVGMFLTGGPAEYEMSPTSVQVDTSVLLVRGDEEQWFTLVDDGNAELARDEVDPTEPLGLKLIGLTVGSILVLREGEDLSYEVKEIQSKYVRAFHETLSRFGMWFPEQSDLRQIPFQDGDTSILEAEVAARSKALREIKAAYTKQAVPLALMASTLGISTYQLWSGLVEDPGSPVWVAGPPIGKPPIPAGTTPDLVVDLSALFTLQTLGLLPSLPESSARVFATESTLDLVIRTIHRDFEGPPIRGRLGEREGVLVSYEVPEAETVKRREALQEIQAYLQDNAQLMTPHTLTAALGRQEVARLEELIGLPTLAGIVLAQELNGVLIADDLGSKSASRPLLEVSFASSHELIRFLWEEGVVTDKQYSESLRLMIIKGYQHVPVSFGDLRTVVREDEFHVSDATRRMLEIILAQIDEGTATLAVAVILRDLWVAPLLLSDKLLGLQSLFNSVCVGRDSARMAALLKSAVEARMVLLIPAAVDAVTNAIDMLAGKDRLEGGTLWRPNS